MARIGKMHRQYVKDMFQKAASGNLVDDKEKLGFQRKAQEAAQQATQAQTKVANRAAMAQAEGAPLMAGQMQESARQMAEASNRAQIQAQGAADQFATALSERRRGEALAGGERLKQQNRADIQQAADLGLKSVESLMGIIKGD